MNLSQLCIKDPLVYNKTKNTRLLPAYDQTINSLSPEYYQSDIIQPIFNILLKKLKTFLPMCCQMLLFSEFNCERKLQSSLEFLVSVFPVYFQCVTSLCHEAGNRLAILRVYCLIRNRLKMYCKCITDLSSWFFLQCDFFNTRVLLHYCRYFARQPSLLSVYCQSVTS